MYNPLNMKNTIVDISLDDIIIFASKCYDTVATRRVYQKNN